MGLKLRRWKDDDNAAHRSIEVALDQHAVDHRLSREHSGPFFPRRESPKKKKNKVAAKAPDAHACVGSGARAGRASGEEG
ncbi:MAG: hypothetical protein R3A48_03810 [Polyangiales bacterium]